MRTIFLLSTWLLACLACAAARGEIFELSSGGRIEGELLNRDQDPRISYEIKTASGGVIKLSTRQVVRVISKTVLEQRYEKILPRMPATADGNWKMAEWCREAGLTKQRELHLQQVLKHEPDHENARHALGYSRVRGRWINETEWMTGQGYVRHGGEWLTQQEVEIEKAREKFEKDEVEWRIKLRRWRAWIVKGRDNQREGLENIQAIKDPAAAAALADLLTDKDEPSPLKLLYIEVLGGIKSQVGVSTFIDLAINDSDANVRDRAIDQLVEFGGEQAAVVFAKKLEDKDNRMVNRAGALLARLSDPTTTLPLIHALVTEHKYQVGQGGGGSISPTFGSGPGGGGLGGLNVGGRAKTVKVDQKNRNVLTALTAIHRGVNFGYDESAWLRWYIEENTPPDVNLRRVD